MQCHVRVLMEHSLYMSAEVAQVGVEGAIDWKGSGSESGRLGRCCRGVGEGVVDWEGVVEELQMEW